MSNLPVRLLLALILGSLLHLSTNYAIAQDDDTCTVEALKAIISETLEQSYDEASELFDAIDTVKTDFNRSCNLDGGVVDPKIATPGIWLIDWGISLNTCEDGSYSTGNDRYVYVGFDNDVFVMQDAWVWTSLEFDFNDSEEFLASRVFPDGDRFEYIIHEIQSDEIIGYSTLTTGACEIGTDFVVTLYDESFSCIVGTQNAVNIRTEPSAVSASAGRFDVNAGGVPVMGKSLGSDNFVWWKIGNDQWVRSDVVLALGNCNSVETIE